MGLSVDEAGSLLYKWVMLNFSSMFANSRASQSASLSELLAPNASLMRLLDEETFLSEFRAGAQQIKEYMTYKKFTQLVELITQVGDPFDKKRSFKFPLTAADLLASETPFVFEKLLPEEGSIIEEERLVTSEEREVEQEVDDDDDEEQEEKQKDVKQTKTQETTPAVEKVQGEDEEEFGEFVAAPPPRKKIIKVKEVVEKVEIVKHQYQPLVEAIFAYFGTTMNYTLTSYCCRVLTALLNKRTAKFLPKFFSNPSNSTNLLTHIGSRSTVQLIVRILTIETKDFLPERLAFFKELHGQAAFPHELEAMSNISAALCETFQKLNAHLKTNAPCKELEAYFSIIPELLPATVDNLISQHEVVSVYSAPFIFHLLNNLPTELDGESVDAALGKLVEGCLGKLEGAVEEKKVRLGVGRVKMLEMLNFILRRPKVREQLAQQKGFFSLLFSLIRAYPLNNILHNEAFKLIAGSLTSDTLSLTENLLSGETLMAWLREEAERERGEPSPGKSPKGYAGHIVNLCKLIRDTNTPPVLKFKQDPSFQEAASVLVDKVTDSHDRNLGGYAMRRNTKFPILFSKDDILKQHATFLSNARPPVFQVDLDDPMQNPALLQELKRQLDGIDMAADKPEQVIQEERHKAELIEENDQHKSAFWKVHLDYDVDTLLDEML